MRTIIITIILLITFNFVFSSPPEYFPIYDTVKLEEMIESRKINNNGWTVGENQGKAILYDQNIYYDFGYNPGLCSVLSINDYGVAVGMIMENENPIASLWDPQGHDLTDPNNKMETEILPTPPEANSSIANDINNSNKIVGTIYALNYLIPVLWDNGQIISLSNENGKANAINNNNQIVGKAVFPFDPNNPDPNTPIDTPLATLFDITGNGENINIGAFGNTPSEAVDINNNGQVIGIYGEEYLLSRSSFLWQNDVITDIGTFGYEKCVVRSINDDGFIVGYVEQGINKYGFLWDSQSGSVDPNNPDGTMADTVTTKVEVPIISHSIGLNFTRYSKEVNLADQIETYWLRVTPDVESARNLTMIPYLGSEILINQTIIYQAITVDYTGTIMFVYSA